MKGFRESPVVQNAIQKAFDETDLDRNGTVDFKELYIALLRVYDKLNSKLPSHVKPPQLDEVNRLMRKFDVDGSGSIGFPEFKKLVNSLLFDKKDWRESLLFKVSVAIVTKAVLFPLSALGIKEGLVAAGLEKYDVMPASVLSSVLEMGFKLATK
jgi:Ca2+-binding EF-hand superfamily protein